MDGTEPSQGGRECTAPDLINLCSQMAVIHTGFRQTKLVENKCVDPPHPSWCLWSLLRRVCVQWFTRSLRECVGVCVVV